MVLPESRGAPELPRTGEDEPLWESAGGQVAQSPPAPPAAQEGEVSAGSRPAARGAGSPSPVMVAVCSQPEALQTGLQLSSFIWCGEKMGSYLSVPAYFTSRDPFR